MASRLSVALLVGGFPTTANPQHGIFNLRTARHLRVLCDVHVIHLQTWRPGRPRFGRTVVDGIDVLRLAAPQLPGRLPLALKSMVNLFGVPLAGLGQLVSASASTKHAMPFPTDRNRTKNQTARQHRSESRLLHFRHLAFRYATSTD